MLVDAQWFDDSGGLVGGPVHKHFLVGLPLVSTGGAHN